LSVGPVDRARLAAVPFNRRLDELAASGLVDTTGFEVVAGLTALAETAGIFVTGDARVRGGDLTTLTADATVGRDNRLTNDGACGDDSLPGSGVGTSLEPDAFTVRDRRSDDAVAFGVVFLGPDPRVADAAPDGGRLMLVLTGGDFTALTAEATVDRDKRSTNDGACGDDLLPDTVVGTSDRDRRSADAVAFGAVFLEPDPRVEELTDAAPDGSGLMLVLTGGGLTALVAEAVVERDNRSTNDGVGVGDARETCGDGLPPEAAARDEEVAAAEPCDEGVFATDARGEGVAAADAREEGIFNADPPRNEEAGASAILLLLTDGTEDGVASCIDVDVEVGVEASMRSSDSWMLSSEVTANSLLPTEGTDDGVVFAGCTDLGVAGCIDPGVKSKVEFGDIKDELSRQGDSWVVSDINCINSHCSGTGVSGVESSCFCCT
jgi:hypothetical protein